MGWKSGGGAINYPLAAAAQNVTGLPSTVTLIMKMYMYAIDVHKIFKHARKMIIPNSHYDFAFPFLKKRFQ